MASDNHNPYDDDFDGFEDDDENVYDGVEDNTDDADDFSPYQSRSSDSYTGSAKSSTTRTPEDEAFLRSLDEPKKPVAAPSDPVAASAQPSGKARERQQKRQQQPMAQSRAQKPPPQTQSPDRRKMPTVKLPNLYRFRYLFALVGAVGLVVLVVAVLGRLRNNPNASLPNAIWLGTEWTYDQPTDEAVAALAARLRANEIGTTYAWVSWLQSDSTWRGTSNFENVQTFVRQFRQAEPDARMMGWVSVPVDSAEIEYRLDDAAVRQEIAAFSRRVVEEFGFDGVYLNVEPVWNNDQNFIELLREVRAAVGPDIPISVAIPPDWSPLGEDIPVPPLIEPGTVWDRAYKQNVALLVDELALMAYNSGLGAPSDYEQWVAYQVETYAEAVAELGEGTDIIVGIPTYDAEPPGHDPYVENVITAINGVRQALARIGDNGQFVRGLALYADWTTTEDEWAAFTTNWVQSQ